MFGKKKKTIKFVTLGNVNGQMEIIYQLGLKIKIWDNCRNNVK